MNKLSKSRKKIQTDEEYLESNFKGKYQNLQTENGEIVYIETNDPDVISYAKSKGLKID